MTWFLAVLVVLAMGAVAVVASGRGASMGPSYDDRADVSLPADRPVSGDDLRALRFNTTVRGYRASEVDALIDRLAAQLDETAAPLDDVGNDRLDAPDESDRDAPQ